MNRKIILGVLTTTVIAVGAFGMALYLTHAKETLDIIEEQIELDIEDSETESESKSF